ncbi:MAG TPA: TatD family hydrolase [Gemmatimonadaceae bacterium]|nr:TatD family hydrolase [Gemmatimonadaceae bacterium]
MIEAARSAGAAAVVCIGESQAASTGALRLATRYPGFVFATAGVHPGEAGTYDRQRDERWIRDAVAAGAVAIGECGLDYHYDHVEPRLQRIAFADQIGMAAAFGRPLIVHTRDAEADTMTAVRDAGAAGVRGVLHCYTGSHGLAQVAIDVGWYVSFAGIVTFAKWNDDALIRLVPEDRILVETDSPYLAPVPKRGRRNEPAFARYTVERLAAVRNTTTEALGAAVTANARRLLNLPIPLE